MSRSTKRAHPARPRPRPRPALAVVLLTALCGCPGSDPVAPPPGKSSDPDIVTDTTWQGTHFIEDTVRILATLTIAPGTVVEAAPGAVLQIGDRGALIALGTDAEPIVFTARDSAAPWAGIQTPCDPVREICGDGGKPIVSVRIQLEHVRIEHADYGVKAHAASGPIRIDHARFRRIGWTGLSVYSHGGAQPVTASRSVIEAGVSVTAGGVSVDRTTIQDAVGPGVYVGPGARLTLDSVTIEGSSGPGLAAPPQHIFEKYGFATTELNVIQPLYVRRNASPMVLYGPLAVGLLQSREGQDRLAGNVEDVITLYGGIGEDIRLFPPHTLEVEDINGTFALSAELRLEAGSELRIADVPIRLTGDGRIVAEGTEDQPVTISAQDAGRLGVFAYQVSPGGGSRLEHVRLSDIYITGFEVHPFLLQHVSAVRSNLQLTSPGSSILDSALDSSALWLGVGTTLLNTVVRHAPDAGIGVSGPDVVIAGCEVTGSTTHGILVADSARGIEIRECALVSNEGMGVHNATGSLVDAAENWWGDEAGPNGPDGDGVSANVTFEPFLTAPPGGSSATFRLPAFDPESGFPVLFRRPDP